MKAATIVMFGDSLVISTGVAAVRLDDPAEAEEVIWDGLSLTNIVVAPHVDNPDFGEGCRKSGDLCERDGYTVQRLTDAQALVIDGDRQHVV